MARYDIVIVGTGLAGGRAAEQYREAGGDGSVLLVGREQHPPYHRPPLTKGFLRGEEKVEDAYLHPTEWWAEQRVELRLGAEVARLDVDGHAIELSDGERIEYGRLGLATGAVPKPHHGAKLIRTLPDSEALQPVLARGAGRLAVAGGGFIGIEAAASARMKGLDVTLIIREPVVWSQIFGEEVGRYFHRQLESHGVRILTGQDVVSWDGQSVRTSAGETVPAEHFVAGVGVSPQVELAQHAGLETGSGVIVDERLSAGSDIWAMGDIAEYQSVVHGKRLRIEHWDVANEQGGYVGRQWAGAEDGPYRVVPYFFSDIADWTWMEYIGPGKGQVDIRGSMDDDDFIAYYTGDDGAVVAALAVNRSDELNAAKELLVEHRPPPAA